MAISPVWYWRHIATRGSGAQPWRWRLLRDAIAGALGFVFLWNGFGWDKAVEDRVVILLSVVGPALIMEGAGFVWRLWKEPAVVYQEQLDCVSRIEQKKTDCEAKLHAEVNRLQAQLSHDGANLERARAFRQALGYYVDQAVFYEGKWRSDDMNALAEQMRKWHEDVLALLSRQQDQSYLHMYWAAARADYPMPPPELRPPTAGMAASRTAVEQMYARRRRLEEFLREIQPLL